MNQAASLKVEISNFEPLINWLESIETFICRLSVYTDKTPPPAMVEVVTKITEELICILALVTKKLMGRKRGEFVLADELPYSTQRRQT